MVYLYNIHSTINKNCCTDLINNMGDDNTTMGNKISFQNITSDVAKTELDSDSSIILLDVRTQAEYDQGHIPNSALIPVDELENRAENELQDKNAKIIVYCRSGSRSLTACNILVSLGYTNVYNMLGGINGWTYETE